MRARQPVEAGAIVVESLKDGDLSGPCLQQGRLGAHHIVVGEAAAGEPFADQNDGAFGLGNGVLADPARLAGLGGQLNLEPQDFALPLDLESSPVGAGGQSFGAGAVDGTPVLVIALQGHGAAEHQSHLVVPDVPHPQGDGGICDGPRLLDADLGLGDVSADVEHGQIGL